MVAIAWCAFALGAWVLQQCARLPTVVEASATLAGPLLLALLAGALARKQGRSMRWAACCRRLCRVALLAGALAGGLDWAAWRAALRLQASLPLALEQQALVVSGVVRDLPQVYSDSTRFVFEVSRYAQAQDVPDPRSAVQVAALPSHLPHRLLLNWYRDARTDGPPLPLLQAGQRWDFTVRLRRPHGVANEFGFDREAWLLERDLRATGVVLPNPAPHWLGMRAGSRLTPAALRDAIDRLRGRLRARIETVLDGAAHTGVVVALATGAQDGISREDRARFTDTGTNHLVAISGLHVGIVAGLCAWLASRLWRAAARFGMALPLLWPAPYVAAVSGMLAAAAYIALAGFGVPAQRAWWMLAAAAVTVVGGRQGSTASALAWALGMIVLVDPWAVAEPGLALSFGSVAAVLLAVAGELPPSRQTRHPAGSAPARVARGVRERVTTAVRLHGRVSVALVPLGVLWFAQIPLVGVPANLLAIPWVSLLVTPLVLLGVLLPAPLDAWIYHLAERLIGVLAGYFDGLRQPSWALWHVAQPDALALLLGLAGVGWWLLPRGWPMRPYGLLLLTPLLWPCRAAPPPGEFRLSVLDVGQGGATLIETAHHSMLFDAGPGPEASDAGARVVVPFLQTHGIDRLDRVMISHGDSDHAGGAAAVFDAIGVASLQASVPPDHRLWQLAAAAGVSRRAPCRAGAVWIWDAVRFEVLWPDRAPDPQAPNLTACVLRVSNARHAAVLPADIEAPSERALVARMAAAGTDAAAGTGTKPGRAGGPTRAARLAATLGAELLLAPHHGSKTSSSATLLAAISPRMVVFQVGYRNRFHHPSPSVVARYRARGVAQFRSDRDGEVRFETRLGAFDAAAYRDWHRRYWMGH